MRSPLRLATYTRPRHISKCWTGWPHTEKYFYVWLLLRFSIVRTMFWNRKHIQKSLIITKRPAKTDFPRNTQAWSPNSMRAFRRTSGCSSFSSPRRTRAYSMSCSIQFAETPSAASSFQMFHSATRSARYAQVKSNDYIHIRTVISNEIKTWKYFGW